MVGSDLSLQLHLEVEQGLVLQSLPLHLAPHLAQLIFQLQGDLIVLVYLLPCTILCFVQSVLKGAVLGLKQIDSVEMHIQIIALYIVHLDK